MKQIDVMNMLRKGYFLSGKYEIGREYGYRIEGEYLIPIIPGYTNVQGKEIIDHRRARDQYDSMKRKINDSGQFLLTVDLPFEDSIEYFKRFPFGIDNNSNVAIMSDGYISAMRDNGCKYYTIIRNKHSYNPGYTIYTSGKEYKKIEGLYKERELEKLSQKMREINS